MALPPLPPQRIVAYGGGGLDAIPTPAEPRLPPHRRIPMNGGLPVAFGGVGMPLGYGVGGGGLVQRAVVQHASHAAGAVVQRADKGKGKGAPHEEQRVEPALGVASVRLPRDAIEQRGSVTFFSVEVTPERANYFHNGSLEATPWCVVRRYNNFFELQERLGPLAREFPGASFPKKGFGCIGQKLESRRQGLELWLMRALESPLSGGLWLQPLRDFLFSGRQFIVNSPPASAPLRAEEPASLPPSAPSKEALYREDTSVEDDNVKLTLLRIQIPDGVKEDGAIINVTAPDGRSIGVSIPPGLSAGADLDLLYDSGQGTLTPVT